MQACTADAQCTAPGAKCVLGSCSNVGALSRSTSPTSRGTRSSISRRRLRTTTSISTRSITGSPRTGQWASLCPADDDGKARAMAIPLDPTTIGPATPRARSSRSRARRPASPPSARATGGTSRGEGTTSSRLRAYYNSCLIAARADYCQDDQSFTRDGTTVDLFDIIPSPMAGEPFFNAHRRPLSEPVRQEADVARGVPDLRRRTRSSGSFHRKSSLTWTASCSYSWRGFALRGSSRAATPISIPVGRARRRRTSTAAIREHRSLCSRAGNRRAVVYGRMHGGELAAPLHAPRERDRASR